MGVKWLRQCLVLTCLLLLVTVCLSPLTAQAERPALKLGMHKVKGDDLLGRVTGIFRFEVQAPEGVSSVTFYVDGKVAARTTRRPFSFVLNTHNYPKGTHTIEAVGYLSNGVPASSNTISLDFRSDNWHLVARQSMFLYALLTVLLLGAVGALGVRRLLRLHPRLILLGR